MENFQIMDRFESYFSKEVLCVGEPLKIVIEPVRRILDHEIVLRIETSDGQLVTTPETLVFEDPLRPLPGQHRSLINIQTSELEPGVYIIKVYAAPKDKVAEEIAEEYAIAGHVFQLLAFHQYEEYFQELFGEEWDDPVYSDSPELKQLSDLFASYNVTGITQEDVGYITKRESDSAQVKVSRSSDSWKSDSFEGLVLSRIVEVIDAAMTRWELPFFVERRVVVSGLPHVDLTKYVWLLNVLGSTWTDLFFFARRTIRFEIAATEEFIGLLISPREHDETEVPEWLMPMSEPPLFHVIRNTIQDDLNGDLRYGVRGVSLMVHRNPTFQSMSAT